MPGHPEPVPPGASPAERPTFELRVPTPADADAWFELFDDPEIMRYISGGVTQNREWYRAFAERQRALAADTALCLFALVVPDASAAGVVAGFVGLQPWSRPWGPAGRTEIGWRLGSGFRGRGLATSGAREALRMATARGLTDPIAMIDDRNAASVAVASKLGMAALEQYLSPDGDSVSMWGFATH